VSARELITEHLDLWTSAVKKKSTSGRGSNGKIELTGIKKLRELILGMAVQGKLTTREASDEAASELLQRVSEHQTQLYTQGKIKKTKKLPGVSAEEQYFCLPKHWEWTRLGTLFDSIMSGGTPSKQNPRFWNGGIPWASVKDLGKTKHLEKTQDYITEEGLKAGSKLADAGDILICTRMGLGKVAICSKPIAFNQDLKAVKVSPMVSLDYFFLAYTTLDITGTGTTVAGITQDKLLNYVIGLPPIEEQDRIVQKVDELMALCDQLEQQTSDQLAALETLVDTLLGTLTQSENTAELADNWARLAAHFDTLFITEQSIDKLKQTILQLAVMGRLVEQDSDQPVDSLISALTAEKLEMFHAGTIRKPKKSSPVEAREHPFSIPQSWRWTRLNSLTSILGDGLHGTPNYDTRGEFYFVNGNNLSDGKIKLSHLTKRVSQEEFNKHKKELNDRTVLVSINGTLGRIAFYAGEQIMLGKSACYFNLLQGISKEYIKHLIQSPFFMNYAVIQATGSTIKNLSLRAMNELPVPLPPTQEQHRIVQKVDELMAICDQLLERLNQASETRCQLAEAVVKQGLSA